MEKKVSRSVKGTQNYGIQANVVTAEVQAIGPHARAEKICTSNKISTSSGNELRAAIKELRTLMQRHVLPPASAISLEARLDEIEIEVQKSRPRKKEIISSLKEVKSGLDAFGGVITSTSSILEAIKKIAKIAGIAFSAIGLA